MSAARRDLTIVTGVLDIGRGALETMGRPFEAYLASLERVLDLDAPLVVHVAPEHEPLVWRRRSREDTRVVPTRPTDLEVQPTWDLVQRARTARPWTERPARAWLAGSPQVALPHYVPLVHRKLDWLRAAAQADPFGTRWLAWLDGGVCTNTDPRALLAGGAWLRDPARTFGDELLVLAFPYVDNEEVHGFDREAMAAACGTDFVRRVVRGGLFGGTRAAIERVWAEYGPVVRETLEAGHLGTEENALTILAHRRPELFRVHRLADGRIQPFLELGTPAARPARRAPRIFVQVASYRDPQLVPTLRDCTALASHPGALRFGVAWQADDGDSLAELERDPRVRLFRCHWRESRGACWARNRLQAFYDGEDFTLQLDSHHRFVPGWDEALVAMLRAVPAERPLLTAYAPAFTPGQERDFQLVPSLLTFDQFTPGGALLVRALWIRAHERLARPIPARFFSAHFCFTLGRFAAEVRHDPELYFLGEEITLAARAFTHGYDLYHPHRVVLWHQYSREGRPKHWDDHPGEEGMRALDAASLRRVRVLLGMEPGELDFGPYGLGTARTLAEYERYVGVSFAARTAEEAARRGDPLGPPPPARAGRR